jgi:Effector-associated domain 8
VKDLIDLLLPNMSDTGDRRALVESALFGCPVLSQINWTGSARTFTVNLVGTLLTYGECAPGRPVVVLLLEELKQQVGVNQHAKIDLLIKSYSSPRQEKNTMEPAGLVFLLEVGRWAMSELKERWTLRRKEQELKLNDMTEPQLEAATPQLFNEMIADKGHPQVERVLERIRSKRDLIEGWKDALVADQKQAQLGDMSLAVLQAKQRNYNEQITRTLREIEDELRGLGFTVEKSA